MVINQYNRILEERIRDVSEAKERQAPFTMNNNAYGTGLYNGLELALSIIEGRPCYFKELEFQHKQNIIEKLRKSFIKGRQE